jgi:small-conductance mechanosensitive channel
MKLNPRAFGLAAGLTAAALSAVCALFVALAPQIAMGLLSDVVHADFTGLTRNVTVGNFFAGVLFWGIGTGLVFAFAGWLYNRLSPTTPRAPVSILTPAQHG